jgi:hypothetical protein
MEVRSRLIALQSLEFELPIPHNHSVVFGDRLAQRQHQHDAENWYSLWNASPRGATLVANHVTT